MPKKQEQLASASQEVRGLSVAQTCQKLGVGRTSFYKQLVAKGLITPIHIGSRTIVPSNQVEALLTSAADFRVEGSHD